MSVSLCFLGNSHIAAIKQAWTNRELSLRPDVSVDFFSASAALLRGLELDGTTWRCGNEELREKIAYTSGGMESIDIPKYDAFAVIGTGFGLDVPRFTEGWDLSSKRRAPEGNLISRTCARTIIETLLQASDAVTLIDTLRSVSDRPVLLCAAPFLPERLLTEESELQSQERYRDLKFLNAVVAMAKTAGEKIAAQRKIELIWQSKATMGVPGFTKSAYGLNPVRFTMKNANPLLVDRKHGNEEYGFIMLYAILRRLHELTGGLVLSDLAAAAKHPSAARLS